MERNAHGIPPESGRNESNVNLKLEHPDAETASRRLNEELPRVQAAMEELELAKNVSRETLERMISI
jgi:hypothetical protein